MRTYKTVRTMAGRKLIVGNENQMFTTQARLAKTLGLSETSAREVLQGETRKGWHMQDMQRQRENMIITYQVTRAGEAYMKQSSSQTAILLQHCNKGEATDIAEAMGVERRLVLILASNACQKGLLTKIKKSGAIFGRGASEKS